VTAQDERVGQLRAAAVMVLALAVAGALLGIAWEAWCPPGPLGAIFPSGVQPDETEAWAAGDGRYAIIVAVVGILAGLGGWALRRGRGPYLVLALVAGGIGGAALTGWIGHLMRGSSPGFACYTAAGKAVCEQHLPLTVHMTALLFVEPALALLVFGLLVAFARHDDLGRPDPVRAALLVPAGGEPDDGWGDGDGAGPPEQGDLAPQ
jgi:hypothetical protein